MRTFLILLHATFAAYGAPVSKNEPPVKCFGLVPKVTQAEYYYHRENGSYDMLFTTDAHMKLALGHSNCLQVNLESKPNETLDVSALFYAFEYQEFLESYSVRESYEFAIPEFQSFCKCDCPGGDNFCTANYRSEDCRAEKGLRSKDGVCARTFSSETGSRSCPKSDSDKSSTLCCEVHVTPYENKKYLAVSFASPQPRALLGIKIYTLFKDHWTLFKTYRRPIIPGQDSILHLNGYANVADVYIFAESLAAHKSLKNGDKYYVIDPHARKFELLNPPNINNLYEFSPNKLGWLRYLQETWTVNDPVTSIPRLHTPVVTNCMRQTYMDHYNINAHVFVVKNRTGGQSVGPTREILGQSVQKGQPYIKSVRLDRKRERLAVLVSHLSSSAPTLKLDIRLTQRLTIVPHVFESTLGDFHAKIYLDRSSNRYLNISLIESNGNFRIEIMRGGYFERVELDLSIATKLPIANNYTEILALPEFISSARKVCVSPATEPKKKICKWAEYEVQRKAEFVLKRTFIATRGNCPGCNQAEEDSRSFLTYLNPRYWFNGVNSFSEGIAVFVEVLLYLFSFVIAMILWRKCLWPLVRWAICTSTEKKPTGSRYSLKDLMDAKSASRDELGV